MQTPRPAGTRDVPQKKSPPTRKLKSPAGSSPNSATKTPKDPSPKVVVDRKTPRIPITQKKRASKVSEVEPQIAQLQDEVKKAKEQLSSSEWWKKRAQQEAEEAKKQLAAMSAKLEDSQKQLNELYESEEARVQELRKISQDRDREWQSELEAVQKQYSMDSAALASAMNEIQKLKLQLDRVSQSEASQARHAESAHAEIRSLRIELSETLDLVDRLKEQLNESREYEARAVEEASKAQLELQSECDSVKESFNSLIVEMEHSKSRVKSLEETVARLQSVGKNASENGECRESENLKSEVDQLRSSLEDAERRYRDEYIQSTMQIRNAYQLVELAKSESSQREAELHDKLKESNSEIHELRTKLAESAALEDLESRLQMIRDENEKLKCEIKRETERSRADEEAGKLSESWRKVARATEQLDAAQASNTELEAELRRLKVQCDQWRKAAEAAAAMLKLSSSPHSDDTDDDSPKKKNGNMLKKIGVLLKKGPK
ncbi:hypothetical protein ACS0TY_027217 [Phlomoides rotata]